MQVTDWKIIALLIALTNTVIIATFYPAEIIYGILKGCLLSLATLPLIWFPDEIGGFTGARNIYTESPPIFVSIMGWFFLISMFLILMFARFGKLLPF